MKIIKFAILEMLAVFVDTALAAKGEMGTGIPDFGMYSAPGAAGTVPLMTIVWSLTNPTLPFPSGCTSITLNTTTMGFDAYKMAIAAMMAAKISGKRIRFYAHSEHENGCGVDYIQIVD